MEQGSILSMPVRKRLRFREQDDMALLREVAGQNPFANPEVWDLIRENVFKLCGKMFSLKTLKDHLDLLIKLWLEKTKILKDKSGIEEEYNEKDQLCQDIFDTMSAFRGKEKKKTPRKKNENAGKVSRDYWANQCKNAQNDDDVDMDVAEVTVESQPQLDIHIPLGHEYCRSIVHKELDEEFTITANREGNLHYVSSVTEIDSTPVASSSKVQKNEENREQSKVLRPIRSRKRKASIQKQGLSYLEQYDKTQMELRKQDQALEAKRLALEERKLEIEEKKLELSQKKLVLEEYERKKFMEIVEQQRKDINKMIERQDKIIEVLLMQTGKNI